MAAVSYTAIATLTPPPNIFETLAHSPELALLLSGLNRSRNTTLFWPNILPAQQARKSFCCTLH